MRGMLRRLFFLLRSAALGRDAFAAAARLGHFRSLVAAHMLTQNSSHPIGIAWREVMHFMRAVLMHDVHGMAGVVGVNMYVRMAFGAATAARVFPVLLF